MAKRLSGSVRLSAGSIEIETNNFSFVNATAKERNPPPKVIISDHQGIKDIENGFYDGPCWLQLFLGLEKLAAPKWNRIPSWGKACYKAYTLVTLLMVLYHCGRVVGYLIDLSRYDSAVKNMIILLSIWFFQVLFMWGHFQFLTSRHGWYIHVHSYSPTAPRRVIGKRPWSHRVYCLTFGFTLLFGLANCCQFLANSLGLIQLQMPQDIYISPQLLPWFQTPCLTYFTFIWANSTTIYACLVAQLTDLAEDMNQRLRRLSVSRERPSFGEFLETAVREHRQLTAHTNAVNSSHRINVLLLYGFNILAIIFLAYLCSTERHTTLYTKFQTSVWLVWNVYQMIMLSTGSCLYQNASTQLWKTVRDRYLDEAHQGSSSEAESSRVVVEADGGREVVKDQDHQRQDAKVSSHHDHEQLLTRAKRFMDILQTDPIGIQVGSFGVIRPNMLISMVSVAFTYFIVLVQLANPPSSDCANMMIMEGSNSSRSNLSRIDFSNNSYLLSSNISIQ